MRKRSNERRVERGEGGWKQERKLPIRNLSHRYRHRLRLLYIYSAYRERRQVLLTPLTTPWTCTLGYMRFSYELLLRCSTWSRTTVYTLQSIVAAMPHYISPSSSSSPTPLPSTFSTPLPLPLPSRLPFISLSYSLSFPYFSTNQRWISSPSSRYPRIPFPRAMNLLLMILFLRRLHAP